jgi:flagellin
MNVIAHNFLAANAATQFGINNKKYAKSSEKLSSGYQINRAADDAAGLSISEKMRSQIRNLNQAAKNVEDGKSLVNVAEGALAEIHKMLARERELLVKAANDVNSSDDRQAIQDEINEIEIGYDEILINTKFNGVRLFNGTDTILAGPVATDSTENYVGKDETTTKTTTEVVWRDKTSTPADTSTNHTVVKNSVSYDDILDETENLNTDDGYPTYDAVEKHIVYNYTDTYDTTVEEKYEALPTDNAYTKLQKPGDMVGNNGYINVENEAGDLSLSCAMSQLGVQVDGKLLTYDLYNSSFAKTTTVSADKNTASTTFTLAQGLTLTQTISLANDSYEISYSVENTSGAQHDVDVRLAFDTMNTDVTGAKSTGATGYTLATDFASIDISASGATSSAIGSINNLYDTWDDSQITEGADEGNHSGVGYWWNQTLADGATTDLGGVSYGPITLLKDPYTLTTTTTTHHTQDVEKNTHTIETTIRPTYLNIQSGANAGERTPVRLFNLIITTGFSPVASGGTDSGSWDPYCSAFDAENGLKDLDNAVKVISKVRSYYGAISNRLDHTYDNNLNYSENLQSAESLIRDTDMASEMTNFTKNSILMQAAQSMISQANSDAQAVLSLLQ